MFKPFFETEGSIKHKVVQIETVRDRNIAIVCGKCLTRRGARAYLRPEAVTCCWGVKLAWTKNRGSVVLLSAALFPGLKMGMQASGFTSTRFMMPEWAASAGVGGGE